MADLDDVIVPGLVHWQHPSFFAYFPSNTSYPSILGELLAAGLGVQGMSWVTSPACTELETLMLDWMVELLDLPDAFRSTSADRRRGDPGLGQRGDARRHPVRPLAGDRRAPSTATATRRGSSPTPPPRPTRASRRGCASPASAPTGCASCPTTQHVRDATPTRSAELIAADRAAGLVPFFVCATHGTTSSMAFDPTAAIGRRLPPSAACGCTSTRR